MDTVRGGGPFVARRGGPGCDVPNPVVQVTDQNDLYLKAWMEGESAQETDTHWRCKKGKVRLA